jgi:hypothetical protein
MSEHHTHSEGACSGGGASGGGGGGGGVSASESRSSGGGGGVSASESRSRSSGGGGGGESASESRSSSGGGGGASASESRSRSRSRSISAADPAPQVGDIFSTDRGLIMIISFKVNPDTSSQLLASVRHVFMGDPKSIPTDPSVLCALVDVFSDPNKNCSVCLSDFEKDETGVCNAPCGHLYHQSCLIPWLKKHNTCPECRAEFKSSAKESANEIDVSNFVNIIRFLNSPSNDLSIFVRIQKYLTDLYLQTKAIKIENTPENAEALADYSLLMDILYSANERCCRLIEISKSTQLLSRLVDILVPPTSSAGGYDDYNEYEDYEMQRAIQESLDLSRSAAPAPASSSNVAETAGGGGGSVEGEST